MVISSSAVAVTQTLDFPPVLSEEFLDIQETIDCGFTLKCVRDMIRTYSPIFKDTVKNNYLVFRWNQQHCTKPGQNINNLKNYVLVAFNSKKFQIDY